MNSEDLQQFLGQQESPRLEFKSSRELLEEGQKRYKFIADQIVPTVSAFLNTDGGRLVVGVEEKDGVANALSRGIPRNQFKWEQLQSAICDRIQPAVAGYVSVHSVPVDSQDGSQLFAFVVDVKPGTTAYQASDRRYYVRRSAQSDAMEDKDIRLRMLAGDKPRIFVELQHSFNTYSLSQPNQYVEWTLCFENIGVRNIPRSIVRTKLNLRGLSNAGSHAVSSAMPEYQETAFSFGGLLPGMRFGLPIIKVSPKAFDYCEDPEVVAMTANVTAFIDDGLPAELSSYDLMGDLRPVMRSSWNIRPFGEKI